MHKTIKSCMFHANMYRRHEKLNINPSCQCPCLSNNSIATLLSPRRLQLICTRKLSRNIYPLVYFLLESFFSVSAHMRQSVPERRKHRAGNFHQWNASRMCRTNMCASRTISASALRAKTKPEPTSVSNMAAFPNYWRRYYGNKLAELTRNSLFFVESSISTVRLILPSVHLIREMLQQGMVVARQGTATGFSLVKKPIPYTGARG